MDEDSEIIFPRAEAPEAIIPVNNSVFELTYNTHTECIIYPKFSNFGWETLYKNYMTNVIKTLNIYHDISRLYLLIKLDLSCNNLTKTVEKLSVDKLSKNPTAVELSKNLKEILPDADPIFLDLVGEMYASDQNGLFEYIEKVTTKQRGYPRVQEYNERIKTIDIINSLTINFKVDKFLSICPDPVHYFKNKTNSHTNHYHESSSYLSDRFNLLPMAKLRFELAHFKFNLTDTVYNLKNISNPVYLKTKRKTYGPARHITYKTTENIEFLKEMAYLDHIDEITNHIWHKNAAHQIKFEEAKSSGELRTCECCFNNELLATEVNCCPAGHYFCLPCIKKGVEVAVGASKIDFKCFADCTEELSLVMIKEVIDEKLYQRIMRHKQAEEIKAADIEGLETCAFCEYSVILSPDIRTINCLNPECKKETCRECREESHFPYRCDQVEKLSEVQIRTMIENKMTEVLIRTCYYCQSKFVKEDGCNKMTCSSCGKQMCYICRQAVDSNYAHFYHVEEIEDKCPLYTDENIVHAAAVEAAGRLTIHKLRIEKPESSKNINIDKYLPTFTKTKGQQQSARSTLDINKLVAIVIGQNVEDINNLSDMRAYGPTPKKARR